MNQKELHKIIAEESNISQAKARHIVNHLFSIIREEVKAGNEFRMPEFGIFKLHTRSARNGVNPKSGEKITIAEKTVPKFKPSSAFLK